MGGNCPDQLELKHIGLCNSGDWTDGVVGEQEGDEVQEGFWREVPKEAIYDDSWDLVRDRNHAMHRIDIVQYKECIKESSGGHLQVTYQDLKAQGVKRLHIKKGAHERDSPDLLIGICHI